MGKLKIDLYRQGSGTEAGPNGSLQLQQNSQTPGGSGSETLYYSLIVEKLSDNKSNEAKQQDSYQECIYLQIILSSYHIYQC